MYFAECARLAELHPDLASVFEQVDSQLRVMGTAVVIRSGDLASFLSLDPNPVISVLEMLSDYGLLRRVEMIECTHCEMAESRTDYQEALREDGEYRCTDCDRPLTDETVETITTYQRGVNWQREVHPNDGPGEIDRCGTSSSSASDAPPDDEGLYTHIRLAEIYKVDKEALRKRLDRFRDHNLNDWQENEDRRPRAPKYLYRFQAIKHIVEDLRASSQRPAK